MRSAALILLCLPATVFAQPAWREQALLELSRSPHARLHPVPVRAVKLNPGFWKSRQDVTIEMEQPFPDMDYWGAVMAMGAALEVDVEMLADVLPLAEQAAARGLAMQSKNYGALRTEYPRRMRNPAAQPPPDTTAPFGSVTTPVKVAVGC